MKEEDIEVVEAMREYGGSFVKQLGYLCLFADANNLQKIKDTWIEYWDVYKNMAERKKI